ncbi:serine/threonine-protein phosphatase 6 regulatory ankyrin repeat subunit C isoform X2 [Hyalella azteca]|nr:serine/threonine-protein phosphatase 6 regulatory ankyrin repeat subunit C isoform X2 [Hyalella azteca]
MGGMLSSFFQSSTALLTSSNHRAVSENTKKNIRTVFDALRANPRVTVARLEGLLSTIPKNENVLYVYNEEGYNLLQKVVGINNVEMVRWVLTRNVDVNRGVCSLPLHIACLRGFEESVEVLLRAGARTDVEARMCWPGPHNQNCEQRAKYSAPDVAPQCDRSSDKFKNAIYYAIDGDQVNILSLLTQQNDERWLPWHQKTPLLHLACERGAWNCVRHLTAERPDEINQCCDENYPIHQAALHHIKFLELLISMGADTSVRTSTQQMTVLHVVFLLGKKSADDTLETVKLLLQHGLKEHINTPDSLGNTPLHALFVRYALEEGRYGYNQDPPPWNKWELLHIVRYLLQHGARASINQPGNSALASVLRHVKDWEFRYELLDMLLANGGNPNLVGRDGSVPLMVCLVPLINKDPLHHFTHTMKIFYLNCVRILCKNGANPNCSSRSNLTPLHVLMFTASENIALSREDMKAGAFSFIQQLLVIMLQHGLDPNVRFSERSQHILLALMDMVQNARSPTDLVYVHELTATLLQYGANPNICISSTEPIICHSQSSVFLKRSANQVLYYYVQLLVRKEELLKDAEQRFARLLYLYYYSMNHVPLYQCLKILHRQTTLLPMKQPLANILGELYTKPRSLKQICRVVIYNSLGRRAAPLVPKLPLPPRLKDYIINLEA